MDNGGQIAIYIMSVDYALETSYIHICNFSHAQSYSTLFNTSIILFHEHVDNIMFTKTSFLKKTSADRT